MLKGIQRLQDNFNEAKKAAYQLERKILPKIQLKKTMGYDYTEVSLGCHKKYFHHLTKANAANFHPEAKLLHRQVMDAVLALQKPDYDDLWL